MTDTPRTHALLHFVPVGDVWLNHSIELERELARAQNEVAAWREKPMAQQLREQSKDIARLRAELARVTKERDEWMERAKQWEPRLISFDSSEIKIKAAHEAMKNLVCMFAELNKDAKNYTESLIEVKADRRAYIVTVRNKDGKTPHELRMEAEKERDELQKECEKLRCDLASANSWLMQ